MKYDNLELSCPILYAPLAGVSDFPFRKMSARYRPGLMFCEMVKMEALVRQIPETLEMLAYDASMRPIGAQLCGSNPDLAGPAAKIIEDLGFDVLDFNCGCPVDKVTKDGSGSGMLKNPERIGEIIANMKAAVKIPVTVKIRIGWDDDHIVAPLVTEIAEKAGATAITIHGRTREQAYRGPAKWEPIRECKQVAREIKVIGNGDIFTADDALRMFSFTGCDGILVARGTMGQPWIADDIRIQMAGGSAKTKTWDDYKNILIDHYTCALATKSDHGALVDMRRTCCWYFKNVEGAKEMRSKASHAKSLSEIWELIDNFKSDHAGD
jgi:tRNA-dihydrouridine synthase B